MGRIITDPGFWVKPPPIMVQNMAQERLINKYQETIELYGNALAALAKHAAGLKKGKRINTVDGGFSFPYSWSEDLPIHRMLQVVEDTEAGTYVVRLLQPRPVSVVKTEGYVPDEQKRMEDSELAG